MAAARRGRSRRGGPGAADAGLGLDAGARGGLTAVAEDSADSIADGACAGSAIGRPDADGRLLWMHSLQGAPKVEGIAVNVAGGGANVCLVTDADDPRIALSLLLLRLQLRRPPS
ncbi:MAG: hypothetical protein HZC37_22150 [Burkholderiales bacterium]|nr:hypothetical protein [Burkholderiales bacterium]